MFNNFIVMDSVDGSTVRCIVLDIIEQYNK